MKIIVPEKVRINFGFRAYLPTDKFYRKMVVNATVKEVERSLNKAFWAGT